MRPLGAGLCAAVSAAAFAALTRVFAFWSGSFAWGAAAAALSAGAGLAAGLALGRPSEAATGWWRAAAALSGPLAAAWLRLAGLNDGDPGLLTPGATASLLPLLPAAALAFLALGRAYAACDAPSAAAALLPPAALLAAAAALGRAEPSLVLALSTPALLLGLPRRAAVAALLLCAAAAWRAPHAFRDVWTLRLDVLYAGWKWVLPPAGDEGLGAVAFPDRRLASLRLGRLAFEDHGSGQAALLAVLGQRENAAPRALLVRPRGTPLPNAARMAGLEAELVDPDGRADALLESLWSATVSAAPLASWKARRRPAGEGYGLLMLRVGGDGGREERAGLADARALKAWRRRLEPGAAAGVYLPGIASADSVSEAKAAASAAFGHAAVLDLDTAVLVLASPQPVLTDAGTLASRLPMTARVGWDPVELLKTLRWRPDGARK